MSPAWPPEPSVWARLRAAEAAIAWRRAGAAGTRVAHLHDEEAHIRLRERPGRAELTVEPGPLGALVALAETDRRGLPCAIDVVAAGAPAPFGGGAVVLRWESGRPAVPSTELLAELLTAARYALR